MRFDANPVPRPRIGYFLATFPAATETFIHREIVGLRAAGVEVEVFAVKRAKDPVGGQLGEALGAVPCFYARPDGLARAVPANLRMILCRPRIYMRTLAAYLREAAGLDARTALRLVFHFLCGAAFARKLEQRGIGALHSHFTTGANVGLAASHLTGLPFSFTAHASGDIFVRPVLLEPKIERADFVACVCDYSRRYLDSITGFRHSDKLVVVPNGLDAREIEQAGQLRSGAQPLPVKRRFRIVSVGSLVGCKGYGTLLEVCAILRDRGHDIELLVLGEGPGRAEFNRLVDRYRLAGVASAPGAASHDQVYAAFSSSDAFALLAEIHAGGYRDGFPTVILEAMAAGLPIVSTYVSGIPEAVVDGVTGFLVKERDPVAAASAVEQLIGDVGLRGRMGAAGRQRVREHFPSERSIGVLLQLLQRGDPMPTAREM
jgi:glycosyltransferase involved in cell wall biosynthesis